MNHPTQSNHVRWEPIAVVVAVIAIVAVIVTQVQSLALFETKKVVPVVQRPTTTTQGYTIADLNAAGIPHTNGVVTAVSDTEREALKKVIAMRWTEQLTGYTAPSGTTAVVLEDDLLLQAAASVSLELLGIKVIGLYPSCEAFQAAPVKAHIYVLDNFMEGAMLAPDCAEVIYAVNPTAIIVLNSAAHPDDPFVYRGERFSLREWMHQAGFDPARVTGVEKDMFMRALGEAIKAILGG